MKRTNKSCFCRAKAFTRMLQISWQLAGLKSKKKMKQNVPNFAVWSGFSLWGCQVVKFNVLAEALKGGCEACGTALRLSNCINKTVSLLFNCYPKLEFGEMNICQTSKTHHRTETKWGRPIFNLLMKWHRQGCRPRRWWNNTIHVIGGLPFDFAFYGMAAIISTIGVCVRHKKHGHRDWGHQMFAKYSKNFTSTSKNIFSKKL